MATIKINYGGTTYSMIKTSSKITTPSVAVDGGWIPCFKGDRFAEVTHGDRIYTLSPLMVNGYRMACGSRVAFNGTIYVHIKYEIGYVGGGNASQWFIEVKPSPSASTSMPGYSCTLSNIIWNSYKTYKNENYGSGLPGGMQIKQPLIATYKVFNASGVVKTGNINKQIYIDPTGKITGTYEEKIAV